MNYKRKYSFTKLHTNYDIDIFTFIILTPLNIIAKQIEKGHANSFCKAAYALNKLILQQFHNRKLEMIRLSESMKKNRLM